VWGYLKGQSKDRQFSDQIISTGQHKSTQRTKDWATWTILKTGDARRCFGRESSSTSGIICVNLVKSWRTVQDYENGTSVTQIKIGYCYPIYHNPILSLLVTYHRVYSKINTTGVTRGEGTAYLSGTYLVLVGVAWLDLYFSVLVFCRSLFVLLSFFSMPLHCLSFFNLRLLITPLVSKWYFNLRH